MQHGGNLNALAARANCRPADILDFSASINPLGPPDCVAPILASSLETVRHYPDLHATELRAAIGQFHAVSSEQVVVGNGSSELLLAIAHAAGQRRWLLSDPCYGGYEHAQQAAKKNSRRLPRMARTLDVDWNKLRQVLADDPDSLVVLDHPHNPSGQRMDFERLAELTRDFEPTWFVIDESFAPFVGDECPGLQLVGGNVIVVRSMTKFYGIPGLRLGYALGSHEIADSIQTRLPEWNVNAIAQQVGRQCLHDQDFAQRSRKLIRQWRQELSNGLEEIAGLHVYPSVANFVLCRLPHSSLTAVELFEKLLCEERIAIRTCQSFRNLDESHVRIAVRTDAENRRLLDALRRVITRTPQQNDCQQFDA